MARPDFKKQKAAQGPAVVRFAIPQIDPERPKDKPAVTVEQAHQVVPEPAAKPASSPDKASAVERPERSTPSPTLNITVVDSGERPMQRGVQMRPSRHKQLRDLSYIEERNFWEILDDALEMYTVETYGEEYRRKSPGTM